jgi:tetraacyldisaccharide-1-P 4'-kinase
MMNWLSSLYAAAANARRRSYERHPDRRRRLQRPVISVGNISVGGSGKTPAVAHLARMLLSAGERPAILTRGYRRREPTDGVLVVSDGMHLYADVARAGDEPFMLARGLPGVGVFVGADRYRSGLLAETRFGCTVHLLDDGFQHVQLARDVDIVVVTPGDVGDRVLPAGRLREKLSTVAQADALVIAGALPGQVNAIADRVTAGRADMRVFTATPRIAVDALAPAADSGGAEAPPCNQTGDQTGVGRGFGPGDAVFAMCGIARPQRFFDALARAGVRVAGTMSFPDHHWFSRSDLHAVVAAARGNGAGRVVTTEKDYVRLLPLRPFAMPIAAVPLQFAIEPADQFRQWLLGRLAAAREGATTRPTTTRPTTTGATTTNQQPTTIPEARA